MAIAGVKTHQLRRLITEIEMVDIRDFIPIADPQV